MINLAKLIFLQRNRFANIAMSLILEEIKAAEADVIAIFGSQMDY